MDTDKIYKIAEEHLSKQSSDDPVFPIPRRRLAAAKWLMHQYEVIRQRLRKKTEKKKKGRK